ncbi:hypothetical protein [Kamptonema formosum]|uniref:hypothetical protein n=1 Tax=Kamptonema formosum TaxID=331992 RepID=UPI000477B2A6|nr:hypothetical protein [Oscillatoria sp. PCC 10802]
MSVKPTSKQIGALQKLFNTGVERANAMLNYMTDSPIHLQMSAIEILSPQQLQAKLEQPVGRAHAYGMELFIRGEFEAIAILVFSEKSAATLVDILADEQRRAIDRDSVKMKTLSEVGNVFFNGIMGAFSSVIKKGITYMAPSFRDGRLKELILSGDSDSNYTILSGQTHYEIPEQKVAGNMVLFFKVDPLERLLAEIDRASP